MKISFCPFLNKLVILLLVFFYQSVNAQKLKGFVYNEHKKKFADVEVFNLSNNFVTVTNSDGSFSVKGKKNDTLQFKYPGIIPQRFVIKSANNIKFYFEDLRKKQIEELKIKEKKAKKLEKKRKKEVVKINVFIKDHELHGNPLKGAVVGLVYDANDGTPLPFVNIIVKGTSKKTMTNVDGYYSIDAKIGDILIISFLGMQTKEIRVDDKIHNVNLFSDTHELSEVVVVGYSSVKKKDLVGSVTAIESKAAGVAILEKKDKSELTRRKPDLKAGQLTAGEVNDFSHYEYWKGLTEIELNQWKNHWKINPKFRYSIILKNQKGFAVTNRLVNLKNESGILWTARTDNSGRAELWYNTNELALDKVVKKLQILDDKGKVLVASAKEFHEGINVYTYPENCITLNKINIAFMIDATGSMGDEISYLQAELFDVIERTKKQFPHDELKMGSVFYRDKNDEYLLKNFDFTTSMPGVMSFIKKQNANGGGDYPEAVIEGLEASIENMNWDDDARAKLLFVLLDAPPHYSEKNILKLHDLAKKAAQKGIKIIPIAASGIDKSTEYLMRALALETNGTYLFITNHSGIGNDHIEPSTESYQVEMLNDLVLRVIIQYSAVNDCQSEETDYAKNSKIEEQIAQIKSISFKYFPNPASDIVTVTLDKEASEFYLFDTTGKLIIYKTDKAKEYKIDVSQLPNAIYYLKVIVERKELVGKIIKLSNI